MRRNPASSIPRWSDGRAWRPILRRSSTGSTRWRPSRLLRSCPGAPAPNRDLRQPFIPVFDCSIMARSAPERLGRDRPDPVASARNRDIQADAARVRAVGFHARLTKSEAPAADRSGGTPWGHSGSPASRRPFLVGRDAPADGSMRLFGCGEPADRAHRPDWRRRGPGSSTTRFRCETDRVWQDE